MKAPFPFFGGKARVANLVWERFSSVANYVEPFFGSGAVLLGRPTPFGGTETVNDLDGFIANFWRSLAAEPEQVASYADWPVNEADLLARHIWLVNRRAELTTRLEGDPDYYDAKIAGWWAWGIACWIGSGWCRGDGPWGSESGQLVHLGTAGRGVHRKLVHLGDAGRGVHRQLVHLGHAGQGVHRQLVHLGDAGRGVHRQRVHLGDAGQGVHRQRVHLGNAGRGVHRSSIGDAGLGEDGLYAWFEALAARFRRVRVCCGDWTRVLGPTPTTQLGLTAVFLDPPYSQDERAGDLYTTDEAGISAAVQDWAVAHGDDPLLRIALCGYDGEHAMPAAWEVVRWKATGGYGSQGDGRGRENAERECIWFSPGCLRPNRPQQLALLTEEEA